MVSDTMVLLDDTLFARGFTFVNRNRLKGPGGEIWITVPVKKASGKRLRIRELEMYEADYWGMKWQRTLYHAYGKSLFFDEINGELEGILTGCGGRFVDMAVGVIGLMRSRLEIETPVTLQSEMGIKSKGSHLIMDLVERLAADEVILPYYSQNIIPWKEIEKKGIKVSFLHFLSPVYPQFWGPFLKNLSALDLLFCLGPLGSKILESGYKIYRY
jgi:hypothetical protein